MILLLQNRPDSVTVVRIRIQHRLSAWLHADRIDISLAGGHSPDSDVHHALRARALTSTRSRRRLAQGIERLVSEVTAPSPTLITRLPLNRARVANALLDLGELRRRLSDEGPVSARGVALISLLLTSGGGPLRGRGEVQDVRTAVLHAIEALDPTWASWPSSMSYG